MFAEAIIHYPESQTELAKICKELAAFRCEASIRYIESLNLTDRQIKTLYDAIAVELSNQKQKTA